MAVFKSPVRVVDAGGDVIGDGTAYIHLPRGREIEQDATGTVSLRRWEAAESSPDSVILDDGRRLAIHVSRSALSDCSRNHILRFTTRWAPDPRPD